MKVNAQVRKLDAADSEVVEVSGQGVTYEEARDAVAIPEGFQLLGWVVPEHLDHAIER